MKKCEEKRQARGRERVDPAHPPVLTIHVQLVSVETVWGANCCFVEWLAAPETTFLRTRNLILITTTMNMIPKRANPSESADLGLKISQNFRKSTTVIIRQSLSPKILNFVRV